MAYVDLQMTSKGSSCSTSMYNNARLRINYTSGNGNITVTSLQGYRTDGYRSYSNYSSNRVTVTIAGNSTGSRECKMIDFGASKSVASWSAFSHSVNCVGNQTVTVKIDVGNNNNLTGDYWSTTIDAGSIPVVVRISNMDTSGNYGSSWVWINTGVAYGSSVEYWGYGSGSTPDNNEYNVVHYANSSVTSAVDTTVYASRRTWYLDVNGNLDGTDSGAITGYGTCNVDVGGARKGTNVSDYYTAHYYGLSYSVSPTATAGHTYNGVTGDALSGTINGAKNVRLKFTTNSYNVAYNANGGSSTPATQSGKYGSSVTLASAIARANTDANVTITTTYNANGGTGAPSASTGTAVNTTPYTFNKWALNSASGTAYSAGAAYTIPAANSTMYATWTAGTTTRKSNPSITLSSTKPTKSNSTVSSYVVTYNANGGTCSTSSQTATKTRSYTFSKWNTKTDGTGTSYNAGTAYTFSANTTLYAIYTSSDSGGSITSPTPSKANTTETITVTFNKQGGTCATSSLTASRTTTYAQNGWWTAASGGTQVVKANTSYTPSSTQTVYAQYTSTAGSWSTITMPTASKPGCTFLGWSTSSTATTATYKAGTAYTISANTTLYAVYSANTTPTTSYSVGSITPFTIEVTPTTSGTLSYVKDYPLAYEDLPMWVLDDGSVWARIFYHDSRCGNVLWSYSEVFNTQSTYKYSRLDLLTNSLKGSDGKFEFMLRYPCDYADTYNRWKQTYAPQDEYITTTSAGDGTATGYEAVHVDWITDYWGGMTRQNSDATSIGSCYLSGSVGHSNWFYAIAPSAVYAMGVPTNGNSTARQIEMWVRVPNVVGKNITTTANTSVVLSDLDPTSNYTISTRVRTSDGAGYSNSIVYTTLEDQAKVWTKKTIPTEYQPLDYVEMSAISYIDTGIELDYGYTFKFNIELANRGGWNSLVGATNDADDKFRFVIRTYQNQVIAYMNGSQVAATKSSVLYGIKETATVSFKNGNSYINFLGITARNSQTSFGASGNFVLFADYKTNAYADYTLGKVYGVTVVDDDGNYIRDFFPCKRNSDSAVGLYDKIEGKFYASLSSNSFVAGNNVNGKWERGKVWYKMGVPETYQQVEYITLTGTQHISLGYAFNPTTDGYSVTYQASTIEQNGMILANKYETSGPYVWCYYYKDGSGMTTYAYTSDVSQVHNTPIARDLLKHTYGYDRKRVYFDGEKVADWSSHTFATADPYAEMVVGYWSQNSGDYHFKGNIYEVILYRDGKEQMYLLPCYRKTDNIAGLYDIIGKKFYSNSGTGEIGKGSVVAGIWTKAKKVWTKVSLPSAYQEVEYIESSGTQYINTGVKVQSGLGATIKISVTKNILDDGASYLGGLDGDTSRFELGTGWGGQNFYLANGASYHQFTNITPEYNKIYTIITNNLITTINGVTGTGPTGGDLTVFTGTGYDISLFGRNNEGTVERLVAGKLYSCSIYDNGILSRCFIPCYRKSDNVIGLYDTVNGIFYTNSGTGDFTKGADINGHWIEGV